MPSNEEMKERIERWKSLFTQPMDVVEHVFGTHEIDFIQIILITLAAVMVGLITSGVGGIWQIVVLPASIFIGAIILLIFALIAGGRPEYIKLVNLAAYLALMVTIANLFARVPVLSLAISTLTGIYSVYLQYIALPYITDCKKGIIKIIAVIQMILIGVGVIGEVVKFFGFFLMRLLTI